MEGKNKQKQLPDSLGNKPLQTITNITVINPSISILISVCLKIEIKNSPGKFGVKVNCRSKKKNRCGIRARAPLLEENCVMIFYDNETDVIREDAVC